MTKLEACRAMEALIPDVFSTVGVPPVNLPQIVVIGCQSSGKSSVLEHIVGRDFLPRGNGIVTRRPLVLQLVNNKPQNPGSATADAPSPGEYGVFLHRPDEQFYDFNAIREEISAETVRVTGTNKAISSHPINLRIYSPRVLNLTLVDLPGITKVPIGDQPSNIEVQIRSMILEYISKPESVILCVTPANADVANSDALKLALEVDPNGYRSIGVLTKLDLMDRGTHCLDVLMGKVIPLRLGFVGVVNRSQEDINKGTSIEEAIQLESAFIKQHHAYRAIANRMGTVYLTRTLSAILINHIRGNLPELKAKIETEILAREKELARYGTPPKESKSSQGAFLLNLLSNFCNSYCNAIEGKSHDETLVGEIYGGARISYLFHHIFDEQLRRISPFDYLRDSDIRAAIRNATGPRPCLFVPEVSFELLVKSQIARLMEPALECIDYVFRELLKIADQSRQHELCRFKNLHEEVRVGVADLLKRCLLPAKDMVRNIIDIELAYINTNHPDFISGSKAVADTMENLKQQRQRSDARRSESSAPEGRRPIEHNKATEDIIPVDLAHIEPTDRELVETEIIKALIQSYFDITRKNIQDLIPKSIMYFLVNKSKKELQSELVKRLYREDLYDELLQESDEVAYKRKACKELLHVLRKAIQIVHEIRDIDAFRL